jgi:sugar phosphate isomerase/epimerase
VTKLIKLCEDNKLVCILNIQDELGVDDISALMRAANYWANNLASAVKGHESTTIVNIENEWDATWESDNWAKGYEQAIPALRNAGIANTLMIDCAGYGQYPNAIWEKGADVLAADKLSNTMFSIHMYEWASYEQPATATGSKVKTSIDKALGVNAPLVIGEFGYKHKDGAVDYQTIMDYCTEKNVGYLGWSWTGNGGGVEFLDMFSDYTDNNMEENGKIIILGKNGIKETSKECSVFGGITTPVVPVDPVTPTSTGFHISGTQLLDANGNNFIMRGVNYSYAWQHGDCSIAQSVISAAKRQKANCIRINLSDGGTFEKTSAAELTRLIQLCKNYNLIAVFNTHDETGSTNTQDLERAVAYWKEMKEILNANTAYVIVNVSNEWYGPWESDPWAAGYVTAIKELRDAGIKNTLLIDCAGYGQYPQSIVDKGSTVLAADADKNTLFSIHMYEYAAPDATPDKVNTAIDGALGIGAPVVIGEFGYAHSGNKIAYQRIMDYCKEKGVGYMGWSWTGNDAANAELDMFADYTDSNIKENGKLIINGTNGIAATSAECSVFSNHSIVTTTIDVCPSVSDNTTTDTSSTSDASSSVIWKGTFVADNWTNLLAINGSYFNNAKAGQKLVFKTSVATGEIQINYGTENGYQKIVDYDNFTNGTYTLILTDANIAQLKQGLVVKGHDYTLTSVELQSNNESSDIDNVASGEGNGVDFSKPYDVYNVYGQKLNHIGNAGEHRIYILHQNGKTFKLMR